MKLFVREKAFYKLLLTIAVPIALQNLITVSVSMMDTLMIGQLGETQLSATSIANQLWFMLMIVCFGVAGGAEAAEGELVRRRSATAGVKWDEHRGGQSQS